MSATLTPSPTTAADRSAGGSGTAPRTADLGTYRDRAGRARALIARPGVGGSVLVIDQDAQTLTDRRLVAHLAADEPAVNARVVAELYLADDEGRRARALDDRDWTTLPGGRELPDEPAPPAPGELRDARGRGYRLATVDDHRYGRQTRWVRRTGRPRPEPVSRAHRRRRPRGLRAGAGADPRRAAPRAHPQRGPRPGPRARPARTQPARPQPRAARSRATAGAQRRAEPVVHRRPLRARQTQLHRPAHRRHHLAATTPRGPARARVVGADAVDPHRRAGAHRPRRAGRRAPGGRAGLTPPTTRRHRSRPAGGRPAAHRRPPRRSRTAATGAAPDPPHPGAAHPFRPPDERTPARATREEGRHATADRDRRPRRARAPPARGGRGARARPGRALGGRRTAPASARGAPGLIAWRDASALDVRATTTTVSSREPRGHRRAGRPRRPDRRPASDETEPGRPRRPLRARPARPGRGGAAPAGG